MKLVEALECLKLGKAMQRAAWEKSGEYVLWLVGAEHLFKVTRNPTNGGGYALTWSDLTAEDWKEVSREDMESFGKVEEVAVADAA